MFNFGIYELQNTAGDYRNPDRIMPDTATFEPSPYVMRWIVISSFANHTVYNS